MLESMSQDTNRLLIEHVTAPPVDSGQLICSIYSIKYEAYIASLLYLTFVYVNSFCYTKQIDILLRIYIYAWYIPNLILTFLITIYIYKKPKLNVQVQNFKTTVNF